MTAQPVEQPAPEPMTVIFDPRSTFAAVPNLLGYHPGPGLHGWLTMKLAPVAVAKRLKPGWHVQLDLADRGGELCDRYGKTLLTFSIVKGHRL